VSKKEYEKKEKKTKERGKCGERRVKEESRKRCREHHHRRQQQLGGLFPAVRIAHAVSTRKREIQL